MYSIRAREDAYLPKPKQVVHCDVLFIPSKEDGTRTPYFLSTYINFVLQISKPVQNEGTVYLIIQGQDDDAG